MRYLAVGRFRMLTTIRSSTPIVIAALVPPLLGAMAESTAEPSIHSMADIALHVNANAAFITWVIHTGLLLIATEAFGGLRSFDPDRTNPPADLMDSAPVSARGRFLGETLGVFAAGAAIHACCLPVLAVVAALSPLPTRFFVWMEVVIVILMIVTSAAAAWKRLSPQTKMSGTRGFRSALLFYTGIAGALFVTTRWEAFRDSALNFLLSPSMRAWGRVVSAIDNPPLLILFVSVLYISYIAFYFVSSTRHRANA
jgi:hypothetical protein